MLLAVKKVLLSSTFGKSLIGHPKEGPFINYVNRIGSPPHFVDKFSTKAYFYSIEVLFTFRIR